MWRRPYVRSIGTTVAAGVLLCIAACGGGGGGGVDDPPLVMIDADFEFFQISYVKDDTWAIDNSAFGACAVAFEADPGVYYLNLVIQPPLVPMEEEWVIQNHPLLAYPDETGWVWSFFDILVPPTTPVPDLTYAASLSNLPLDEPPATFAGAVVTVQVDEFWTGDTGGPTAPPAAPAPVAKKDTIKLIKYGFATKSKFPNQEQQQAECVPGAVSNSVKYLNSTRNLGLSDAQTNIDAMKPKTNWSAGPPAGSSTGATNAWWDKKATDLAQPPYDLDTTVNQQNGTQADRVSDFDQMIDDVKEGDNVEVRIAGHAANVVGAMKTEVNGRTVYVLEIQHDTVQGRPGGTKRETVTYDPSTNTYSGGWLFDGAQHDRFIAEAPKST